MGRPRWRRWWPALLLASVTACGTTVPLSQQSATGADGIPAGAGAGDLAGTGSAPGALPGAAQSGGASGSAPGAAGTTTGTAPGTAAGTGSTGVSVPRGGPADRSPLKVGVFYLNGGNAVISAGFPGSSVSFGDGKREAQAVIDDVNAHGGAAGRRIVPVWVPVNAQDNDANRQRACKAAVDDNHPVALLAMFNLTAGLAGCAQQTHTLLVDVALGAGDNQMYADGKNLVFSPSQMTRDAEQKLVLTLARQQGRLPAGKTVGIVYQDDDPMYGRVVHRTIEPLLRSLGVPYDEQGLSSGTDTSGMGTAILKFKSAQPPVDTVVFSFGSGGIPEVLFMQAAEQQQYRPQYLMGDSTDTNFVGQEAPANQIKRIAGAGTYPLANVRSDQYPSSRREKQCLTILNRAIGGYKDRYTSLTGTFYCELVWSFAFVASRVSGAVTSRTWADAYHALGTAYEPVTTFSTRFLPGRQDGASAYRALGYGGSCSCITYTSPIRAIALS